MNKFKEFKQKIKDNKGKIITGIIFVSGAAYIVVRQHGTIKDLSKNIDNLTIDLEQAGIEITTNRENIDILKHVMNGTVLASLKESLTRKLRYREGKLNNALMKNSGISEIDMTKLREEIAYFSAELEKIFKAEELLNNSTQRD